MSAVLLAIASAPRLRNLIFPKEASSSAVSATSTRVETGTEVIAFFLASSTCGASQHPRLPSALKAIRTKLNGQSQSEGKRFVYVGVAVDDDPDAGLTFLKPFGPFDEIVSGGGRVGTGSVDLLIRGMPGPLSLPQLIIVERTIEVGQSTISVGRDHILSRKLGFDEILKFAN